MVGKRKRFLRYIASNDIVKYRELTTKLGIRKQASLDPRFEEDKKIVE